MCSMALDDNCLLWKLCSPFFFSHIDQNKVVVFGLVADRAAFGTIKFHLSLGINNGWIVSHTCLKFDFTIILSKIFVSKPMR